MANFGGSDTSLQILIQAKDEASKVFKTLESNVKKSAKSMKSIGESLTKGLTIPLAALGTGAVVAAGNFEKSLGDLSTLIGAGSDDLKTFDDGIKDIMKRVPKSGDDLGASAYSIVSAGITDASQALKVLETSGKLAVAGLSTTAEATDLLTGAINAFGLDAEDADAAADILFKTVKAGKTTVADLSQAFGKMAGNAAAANIGFRDVQAATAALTTVTGKTSESQNALAQVFLELTVSSGKLATGLEDSGSSLKQLQKDIRSKGLVGGFEEMRDNLGLTDTEFKNLFSSAEGGTAVFQLLTSANKSYSATLEDMKDETNALDVAFKAQKETFLAQWQLLKNKLNVQLIKLGTAIMPTIKEVMEKASVAIGKVADWFANLSPEAQKFIIIAGALLAVLGPIIVALGAILTVLPAIGAAFVVITGPIGLVIGSIAAITAAIIYMTKNWEESKLSMLEMWSVLTGAFKTGANFLIGMAEGIGNAWVKMVNTIVDALNKIQISIPEWVPGMGGKSFGINLEHAQPVSLQRFEHGGIVPGAIGTETPIMAHGQEQIIPAGETGGVGNIVLTINNPVFRNNEDERRMKQQLDAYFRPLIQNHKLNF